MKISPIAYAIHDDGDSRVFGESVTIVSVEDEAAGELRSSSYVLVWNSLFVLIDRV